MIWCHIVSEYTVFHLIWCHIPSEYIILHLIWCYIVSECTVFHLIWCFRLPCEFLLVNRHFYCSSSHLTTSQSLNLDGRRGTTDDVATIPFHHSRFSAVLRESPNSIPVHSLMLSSHFFLCLLLFLAPLKNCLRHARGSWNVVIPSEFLFLHHSYEIIMYSGFCCKPPHSSHGLCRKYSEVSYSISSQGLGSSFRVPAVKVQFSQEWRNVGKISARISFILEASEMFLSLHMIFSLEGAAVVLAILEKISCFDSSFNRDDWSQILEILNRF